MTLPIARTEPSCFFHVGGCRKAGGAKMAVGDGAASCEPKAPFVSSGPTRFHRTQTMRSAIIILFTLVAVQFLYDAITFRDAFHGEIAWRIITHSPTGR